ncbi:MAG: tetratricopeptide repeat protein [Chlamydiales bacterium]|nr:tetratricopeptide repeat protein [Chlamydiales bacterium]
MKIKSVVCLAVIVFLQSSGHADPLVFLEHTEPYWEHLLKQEPDNPYYLYRLGKMYAQKEDYQEAEPLLSRSLELNPEDADVKLSLAYLYLWTDRVDKARTLFQEILEAFPEYEEAQTGLKRAQEGEVKAWAEVWKKTVFEQEATLLLELLIKIEPKNAHYLFKLGRKFAQEGKYKRGEELLKRSLELNPKDADVKLALAYLYLWDERPKEAEELFTEILREFPDYKEAEEGLKRARESLAEKKKDPTLLPWQKEWIKIAEKLEGCYQYDKAMAIWHYLFCTSSQDNRHLFAARIGQLLSWKGRWREALCYLNLSLSLDPEYHLAKLRLAYVYLFTGRLDCSRYLFCSLVRKDSKDSDAWEGYARASAALLCNCEAKEAFCCRLGLAKPTYDLYKQFHFLLKWTNPWLEIGGLYAQERETDLITKVRSAQRNTAFGEVKIHYPLTSTSRLHAFAHYGFDKEINLIQGIDNFALNIWKFGFGYDSQLSPRLTFRSWAVVKEGEDPLDNAIFPLGRRRRFEPGAVVLYNWRNLNASFSAARDSFIVKNFQNFNSTLLVRDTCLGEASYGLGNNQGYFGLSGFTRFYHEFKPNRQWEGSGWLGWGFPKYKPCLYIQYRGRIGGFRFTDTNYYSYSTQWEHFGQFYYRRQGILYCDYEFGYMRSWQWSRDLNQPIDTVIFVPSLFRITNRGYAELSRLFSPRFWVKARGEYYHDTTEYTAWIVRGEVNIVF